MMECLVGVAGFPWVAWSKHSPEEDTGLLEGDAESYTTLLSPFAAQCDQLILKGKGVSVHILKGDILEKVCT